MKALLLLFSSLKFGKILLSIGTMMVSVVAYTVTFGLWYAVGFVALLFAHEMGHYLAARQRNLDVGLPMFIPFVGAWIQLKETPHDVETEAYVGLAGPVVGTVASLLCYLVASHSGSRLLLAVAYAGFFINLFNLLPISPLDGGRITAIISRKIWYLGVPLLIAAFFYTQSPLLILIAIIAAPQLMAAWRGKTPEGAGENYYQASLEHRVNYAIWYLGLSLLLATMTYQIHMLLEQ
jgi:Zn-dependent protease